MIARNTHARRMPAASRDIGAAIVLLATTYFVGGRPWAAMCAIALAGHLLVDGRGRSAIVVGFVPALVWLALFRATGNRELFFPYTMSLASYAALLLGERTLWKGGLAGAYVVGVFAAFRAGQAAATRVLAVEIAVAGVVLTLALAVVRAAPRSVVTRLAITAAASLLACAGLAI